MHSQVSLQGGRQREFERRGRRQWDDGSRCGKDDVMYSHDPKREDSLQKGKRP